MDIDSLLKRRESRGSHPKKLGKPSTTKKVEEFDLMNESQKILSASSFNGDSNGELHHSNMLETSINAASESDVSNSDASKSDTPSPVSLSVEKTTTLVDTVEIDLQIAASKSDVSNSAVSVSDASKSDASNSAVSVSDASKSDASNSAVSVSDASKSDVSNSAVSVSDASKSDVSKSAVSVSDASKSDVSSSAASVSDVSKSDVSSSAASVSDVSKSDVSSSAASVSDASISHLSRLTTAETTQSRLETSIQGASALNHRKAGATAARNDEKESIYSEGLRPNYIGSLDETYETLVQLAHSSLGLRELKAANYLLAKAKGVKNIEIQYTNPEISLATNCHTSHISSVMSALEENGFIKKKRGKGSEKSTFMLI